jgi:hypothetical protein
VADGANPLPRSHATGSRADGQVRLACRPGPAASTLAVVASLLPGTTGIRLGMRLTARPVSRSEGQLRRPDPASKAVSRCRHQHA